MVSELSLMAVRVDVLSRNSLFPAMASTIAKASVDARVVKELIHYCRRCLLYLGSLQLTLVIPAHCVIVQNFCFG